MRKTIVDKDFSDHQMAVNVFAALVVRQHKVIFEGTDPDPDSAIRYQPSDLMQAIETLNEWLYEVAESEEVVTVL